MATDLTGSQSNRGQVVTTIRTKVGTIIPVNGNSEWLPKALNPQRAMEMVNRTYHFRSKIVGKPTRVLHRYTVKLRMDYQEVQGNSSINFLNSSHNFPI